MIRPLYKTSEEDEIHFLRQCPAGSDIRHTLVSYFHYMDVVDQYVYLMSHIQKLVIKLVANAVQRIILINIPYMFVIYNYIYMLMIVHPDSNTTRIDMGLISIRSRRRRICDGPMSV